MMRIITTALNIVVAAVLTVSGAMSACTPSSNPATDDGTFALESDEIVGMLAYGQTSAPTPYSSRPRYRAFTFGGNAGDMVDVWVRSVDGVARAWLVDPNGTVVDWNFADSRDAHIVRTLKSDGLHDIVFREATLSPATFIVSLSCTSDDAGVDGAVDAGADTLDAGSVGDTLELPPSDMAVGRDGHIAELLANGHVLVAGGDVNNASVIVGSSELYDPTTGLWADAGNMPRPHVYALSATLSTGDVLVAGGQSDLYGSDSLAAELFDPITRVWTKTGSMAQARFEFAMSKLASSDVLAIGGRSTLAGGAERFSTSNGTWSAAASPTLARSLGCAVLLADGRVLVAGGVVAGNVTSSGEVYDPNNNTWTSTASMTVPRYGHAAALLGSGKVLVMGGASYPKDGGVGGPQTSAELFDPNTNSWTPTGNLNDARVTFRAVVLQSGRVAAIGGWYGDGTTVRKSVEVYDPGTETWTVSTPMTYGRSGHTATRLLSGHVLVAGGASSLSGNQPFAQSNTAEILAP